MKLFKRIAAAVLASVLALTVLVGCSGGGNNSTPLPSDAKVAEMYQNMAAYCASYNVKAPVYSADLDQMAKEIADAVTIHRYYKDNPSTAVLNQVKAEVAALAEGAEYIGYDINPVTDNPLSFTALKNTIAGKGVNRVGLVIVTKTVVETGEEVDYYCMVYARYPDAAAQN